MVKSMSNRPELKKQNSYQTDAGVIREPVTFRGRRIQKLRSVLSVNSTNRSARIIPMYLRAMDMRRRDDRYLKQFVFVVSTSGNGLAQNFSKVLSPQASNCYQVVAQQFRLGFLLNNVVIYKCVYLYQVVAYHIDVSSC